MNGFCCSSQMDLNNKSIEFKFKNKQKAIQYSLQETELFQKSVHSLRQRSLYEEVSFNCLLFTELTSNNEGFHYKWIEEHCYRIRKKDYSSKFNSNKIVILHLVNKGQQSPITLIVSHDHLTTLGHIYPLLIDLSSQLKCDVISYDYSGYGLSSGIASESEAQTDLEAVSLFCSHSLKILNEKLVLLSIGLGAIPTLSFVSQPQLIAQNIKALILLSPILESKTNKPLEYDVNCPVLLIHGQANQIVDYSLTKAFARQLKTVDEWYPSNGSYSNITLCYRKKFYLKLKVFLSFVQTIRPKSRYMTTPLLKKAFTAKNINSDEEKLSTEFILKTNKKGKDIMYHYASSCVSSSSIDSSINDNTNNKANVESSNTIEFGDYFGNSDDNANDNNVILTAHRKDSNMILNTIRNFNVNK